MKTANDSAGYEDLPLDERMRRIGELIRRAISRTPPEPAAPAPTRPLKPEELLRDDPERRIFAFLAKHGSASPRDLEVGLGLQRLSVQRRLARLRGVALLQRTGSRRAVRYSLRTEFGAN